MNKNLFKYTLKSNWVVGLIIFLVMLMYLSIMISMYDPDKMESLSSMMDMFPEGLISAMGFENFGNTLTTYLGNSYYNFIAIMFPMIYVIIVANRLIAKHVDSGSMAYLLSTPNSRKNIGITQAIYLILSIIGLFLLVTLSGITISQVMFPGELEIDKFLLINLVATLTIIAIGGISFLSSCVFNDTKNSVGIGAGIPIGFFVLNMLANAGDKFSWLENFTIFTFLNPEKIIESNSFIITSSISLIFIAIVCYGSGVIIFNRRNLPL